MSEKEQITNFPKAMTDYADYVDPQMVDALLRAPDPDAVEWIFGPRPRVKLTRRERLLCKVRYRIDRIRTATALKIAPWLGDGE